jgi:hypothetical protein
MPVGASGYHSPASFHKDDHHGPTAQSVFERSLTWIDPGWTTVRVKKMRQNKNLEPGPPPRARLKLLNMRDFRALSGFPSGPKRATTHQPQTGESIGLAHFLGPIPQPRPLMPKRAIGRAKFRAYMQLTHR